MSFFANLLGGTLQGVGAGMSAIGADEERMARERALIHERNQAALDLQQQRASDRLYQQEQLLQMKSELGGGAGGGGGKGINLAQLAMQARTPEEQDRVIRLAQTFGGDDAGATIADKMFGRPQMTGTAATAGDFARYDRAGAMEAAPPTTTLERAAYDRDQGQLGLQRLYTAFLDPGKLDDHAKGEKGFALNDMGAAGAREVLASGGSLEDAATAYQRNSAPKDESEKNALAAARAENAKERNAIMAAAAEAKEKGQAARALDRQISDAYKELNKARPKDKAGIQQRIDQMEGRRDAMDAAPAAAAPARDNTDSDTRSVIEANNRSIALLQKQPLNKGETQASRDEQIRMIQSENARMQAGRSANPGPSPKPEQQAAAAPATPAGLPAGARQIGTSKGRPVYELPDGRRVVMSAF